MKIILSTTPNLQEAEKIAKSLVEKHLAACVNIVPQIVSCYEWEGEIQNDNEALMIIKTSKEKAEKVEKEILNLHSYTLPEIIFLEPTGGYQDYKNWVLKQVTSCCDM